MSSILKLTAYAMSLGLSLGSVAAVADDHAYTEGPVVNVSSIRTVNGKFDDGASRMTRPSGGGLRNEVEQSRLLAMILAHAAFVAAILNEKT